MTSPAEDRVLREIVQGKIVAVDKNQVIADLKRQFAPLSRSNQTIPWKANKLHPPCSL